MLLKETSPAGKAKKWQELRLRRGCIGEQPRHQRGTCGDVRGLLNADSRLSDQPRTLAFKRPRSGLRDRNNVRLSPSFGTMPSLRKAEPHAAFPLLMLLFEQVPVPHAYGLSYRRHW
jgi:hypothetical protein